MIRQAHHERLDQYNAEVGEESWRNSIFTKTMNNEMTLCNLINKTKPAGYHYPAGSCGLQND